MVERTESGMTSSGSVRDQLPTWVVPSAVVKRINHIVILSNSHPDIEHSSIQDYRIHPQCRVKTNKTIPHILKFML